MDKKDLIIKINSFSDIFNEEVDKILEKLLEKEYLNTDTNENLFNPFENSIFEVDNIESGNFYGDILEDNNSKECNISVDNNVDSNENYSSDFDWTESKESAKKESEIDCSEEDLFSGSEKSSENESDYKDSLDTNSSEEDIEEDIEIEDIEMDTNEDLENYVEMDENISEKNKENPFIELSKKHKLEDIKLPPIKSDQFKIKELHKTISISKLLINKLSNDDTEETGLIKRTSPISYKISNNVVTKNPYYYSKIYQRKSIKRTYKFRCPECFSGFNTEWSLNDHFLVEHNSFENTDPNYVIPTSSNGKYKCPICTKNYITNGLLGEHFILEHNDYDELCTLDNKDTDNIGYPSLNLLEYISMIKQYKKATNYFIFLNEECNICYSKFKEKKKKYRYMNKCTEGYNSDNEINYRVSKVKFIDDTFTKKKINKYIDNKKRIWKERTNITMKELIKIINKHRIREYIPISLECCKKFVCKSCLIEYLKHSNSITCPFCKKDHTREDLEYIRIVDLDDKIDGNKWKLWWNRHINIFFE
jgi:hypothetical protein